MLLIAQFLLGLGSCFSFVSCPCFVHDVCHCVTLVLMIFNSLTWVGVPLLCRFWQFTTNQLIIIISMTVYQPNVCESLVRTVSVVGCIQLTTSDIEAIKGENVSEQTHETCHRVLSNMSGKGWHFYQKNYSSREFQSVKSRTFRFDLRLDKFIAREFKIITYSRKG